jgi:hypothetical protein
MLQPGEQAALRRLSVFAGSFCLAAAQPVATLGGTDPADVLDLLARLVDRSLLLVEHTPAEARYRMLATVRRYGAHRLAEADEYPAASQAMLSWYLDLAEQHPLRFPTHAGRSIPGCPAGRALRTCRCHLSAWPGHGPHRAVPGRRHLAHRRRPVAALPRPGRGPQHRLNRRGPSQSLSRRRSPLRRTAPATPV